MNTSKQFIYGANFKIVDKTHPDKLSYAGAFSQTYGTFTSLARHIGKGHPWMPVSVDKGKRRLQVFANYTELLTLDIDHDMTIEQFINHRLSKFFGLGIESANSTAEDNRFRVVARLPKPLKTWKDIKACNIYLMHLIGVADENCKDASRFYFGSKGKEPFLLNESAVLWDSFVEDARAWLREIEIQRQKRIEVCRRRHEERLRERKASGKDNFDTELAIDFALTKISPRRGGEGTYGRDRDILWALKAHGGEQYAIDKLETLGWSGWNIHQVAKGAYYTSYSIGTVFYHAEREYPDFWCDFFRTYYKEDYQWKEARPPDPPNLAEYLAWEADQDLIEQRQDAMWQEEAIKASLDRLQSMFTGKRTGAKTQSKGFGNQAQAQKTEPTVDLLFKAGQDFQAYREAMNRGFQHVLNNAGTGQSKTYTSGTARVEDFPWEEIGVDPKTGEQFRRRITADRLIFVTNDAQNPTTETLKSWKVITPRHNGRYIDPKGKKRRITNSDQKMAEKPNCSKVDEILALVSKNVPNAQTDLVCQSCPMLEVCVSTPGWQKHDRRESFEADQNLSHILSLPGLENFDYSSTIIFWDEPDSTFVSRKTIKVSASDIDQTIAALAVQNPELFEKLRDALVSLKNLLTIEAPRYGFDYHAVKANLPEAIELSSDEWTELIQALAPDFTGLENPDRLERSSFYEQHSGEIQNIKTKYEKELADLKRRKEAEIANADLLGSDALQLKLDANNSPQTRKDRIAAIKTKYKEKSAVLRNQRELKIKQVKSELAKQARQTERALVRATAQPTSDRVEIIERNILKQWLPELLAVLQGAEKGDLRVNFSQLIINIRDDRFADIAKAAKLNVYLDATMSREDLANKLGIDPSEIFVVKQKDTPTPNLKITQINDLGRMGMSRGKEQERRLVAIVNHLQQVDPDVKVIDFKKFATDELTGAWWRDSRGVNDYLTTRTLLLAGTPCQNLADLIAEYSCNTGMHPEQDDPGFMAFVDRKIRAEFIQGIGRPRAHRRSGEEIHVVIISDFDLQLDNVEQVKASDITIDAATKPEQAWMAIREMINRWWSQNGELPTQNQISEETGFKQNNISRLISKFAGGWKALKRLVLSLVCPTSNPFDGEPSEDEARIAEQTLAVVLDRPSEKVASALNCIIEAFGWRGWRRILSLTKQTLRLELLAALFRDGFNQTDQSHVLTG